MSIPLSLRIIEDKWYWKQESGGVYTVKNRYQSLQDDLTEARSEVWVKLWKLSIPPKVTNFMWRTLSGLLPTANALRSCMVQMDPTCPICLQERESIHHLFLHCHLARECWILTPLPILGLHDSITSWVCRIF